MLVLAACTQSKRGVVAPRRRLRQYTLDGDASVVAKSWAAALRGPVAGTSPLTHLYKGGYWSAAVELLRSLPGAELAVVSAGLGLVPATAVHGPYSATFSSGHPDSVPGASDSAGRAKWWGLLGASERLRAKVRQASRVFVVLPNRYLDVVADDLLASDRGHVQVFASACPRPLAAALGRRLFQVKAPMIRQLGTNVSALAPKAATFVLEGGRAENAELRRRFEQLEVEDEAALYPVRKKQTPQEVAEWLRSALATAEPPTSATAALRAFRASGRAFEQKRFHRLFREVVMDERTS